MAFLSLVGLALLVTGPPCDNLIHLKIYPLGNPPPNFAPTIEPIMEFNTILDLKCTNWENIWSKFQIQSWSISHIFGETLLSETNSGTPC